MNTDMWDRIAASYRADHGLPADVAHYGPDVPTERTLRLVGDVRGKRVLELGCGAGQASIAFAKQGATAIGVDASAAQLAHAHRLAEQEEVKVEWQQCDVADLAFLRADSIDLVFSAYALSEVEDLSRVFRQVHRVMRHHAMFVFSYEHPFSLCAGRDAPRRSYFDHSPITVDRNGESLTLFPRTIGEVFMSLGRAGFRVDTIVEPEPVSGESPPMLPSTVVWRARKEGI